MLKRLRQTTIDINNELKSVSLNLKMLLEKDTKLKDDEKTKVTFLVDQLVLQSKNQHGERYDSAMIKTAISLYLRSRSCYCALREYDFTSSEHN